CGVGPDVMVSEEELDEAFRRAGMPGGRIAAVQKAQGWSTADWEAYKQALEWPMPEFGTEVKLRELQAPLGVVEGTLEAMISLGLEPQRATIGIDGTGPFGRKVAELFARRGANILALAGRAGGYWAKNGLDVPKV